MSNKPEGVKMVDLTLGMCRYPLWKDDGRPHFMHCGKLTTHPGGPWCAEHIPKVFNVQANKKPACKEANE